jgi:Tol biopolymer transport system component
MTLIGTTLRHYRIVRAIGHGGMGEIYAAEDLQLHRLVALKTLPPDVAGDPERLHRFQREAQAVAALNHPNIVTLYGVEEADGIHFLTMELVEGRTLGDVIPPGGLPLNELLAIAIPLADAVRTAHEHGVVHRDLKPANIMIGPEGRLKVLDFGLAKQLRGREGQPSEDVSTAMLTAPFHVVGTAAYMSPEQAQGQSVDGRSDIFSLGVVLYEMATGARPFRGDSSASVMASIIRDDPPAPSDLNAAVPPGLDRAIRRCLAKEPDRRYQAAADLRNDLEALQRHATGARSGSARRVTSGSTSRRRLVAWGALGFVLVAGGSAAVWKWRPLIEGPAAPLRPEFLQLTSQPGVEWFPSLSPDGTWIVYAGDGASRRHIYLQSVSGQTPLDISGSDSADDDDQPAFSPDGERIAFRSTRLGGGLFVMGRTGEAVRRVATAGFNPAWSPDGSRLAYTSERMELYPQNSAFRSELWIVDLRSEQTSRLSEGDAVTANWSPHGQRIAFTRRQGLPMQSDIWTIPAAGGAASAVTNDAATDFSPAWSPDGRYLYFSSDRGGSMNLWRVRVDEDSGRRLGEPEPLTTPAPIAAHATVSADGRRIAFTSALVTANIQRAAFDPASETIKGEPSWVTTGSRRWSSPDPSPDGQWVAFYSLTRPEGDLYLTRPDGTSMRQLTGDPAVDRVPRWSPDGQWIVCFSTRSGPSELWKIRPDGSGLQQLTEQGGSYFAWSPDGSRIANFGDPSTSTGFWIFDPGRPWKQQKPELVAKPLGDAANRFFVNSWSPDGTRIVGEVQGKAAGVLMYTLATRTYDLLTDFGEWPVWLPDGRHVLFVAGGKAFYVLDTRTRAVKRIYTVARDVIGPPRLSRDATAMYYSRRVTESDIWLATLK